MKLYAVGLNGYTELRASSKAPELAEVKRKRSISWREPRWDFGFNGWTTGPSRRQYYTVKDLTVTGGKMIASFKSRKFGNIAGFTVRPGRVIELPPGVVTLLAEHEQFAPFKDRLLRCVSS